MGDEVVVVGFTSAGLIGSVTHIDKEYAANCAIQLRRAYPSVRCMSYEEFIKVQEKEQEERSKWNTMQ